MSRVDRLQVESSKLREEIKQLKEALNEKKHEVPHEVPVLKPRSHNSPMAESRKKAIREEINLRLNYVIPTTAILKKKSLNSIVHRTEKPYS